jgi:hypothetical protein
MNNIPNNRSVFPSLLILMFLFTVYFIPEDMYYIGGFTIKRFLLLIIAAFNFPILLKKYILQGEALKFNKNIRTLLFFTFCVYIFAINSVGSIQAMSTIATLGKFLFLTLNVYLFLIFYCNQKIELILKSIVIFGFILSIIIFIEQINGESFYVKYLGYDLTESSYLNWWYLGVNHTNVLGLRVTIPTGPFSSAHDIGIMQSFPLCYSSILFFSKKSLFRFIALLVIFLSMFFSFKFTNIIVGCLTIIVSILLSNRYLLKSIRFFPLITSITICIALIFLSPIASIIKEIVVPGTEIYIKYFGRSDLFLKALDYFNNDMNFFQKLTGIGFGINQAERGLWLMITGSLGDIGVYWEKLIELGIIGFSLLLLFYFSSFYNFTNLIKFKGVDYEYRVILCSIIAYMIVTFFVLFISFKSSFWYYIAIVLGIGSIIRKKYLQNNYLYNDTYKF